MNLLVEMTKENETYNLPRANCKCYEPLANDEGTCSITHSLVSRVAGCNFPENCIELKRHLETIKRK